MTSLMVAMTVSCGMILASISLLQIARDNFQHHHQAALLEDSAAFALEIISRTLQQAAQNGSSESLDPLSETSPFNLSDGSVQGLDNARMSSDTTSIGTTSVAALNGNDVMAVNLRSVDGDVLNCAGFVVPAGSSHSSESAWVMFHVVPGIDGEPDLHCRYRGQKKWDSQAILSGVEYFQVLYGLDTDEDNLPNQYLSASAIAEKDKAKPASDPSWWRRVAAVHVALVLRSPAGDKQSAVFKGLSLFGDDYVTANASADPGTRIAPDDLVAAVRTRARRQVDAVIFLHRPALVP